MQLLLLIAGLVLLLVGGSWFTGAAAVGAICLIVFGIITVLQIVTFAVGAKAASEAHKRFGRGSPFDRF